MRFGSVHEPEFREFLKPIVPLLFPNHTLEIEGVNHRPDYQDDLLHSRGLFYGYLVFLSWDVHRYEHNSQTSVNVMLNACLKGDDPYGVSSSTGDGRPEVKAILLRFHAILRQCVNDVCA